MRPRRNVKIEYDPSVDAAYLTLESGKIVDSEQVKPGLVLDFDKDDHLVGVEILRFSRRFKPNPRSRRTNGSRR